MLAAGTTLGPYKILAPLGAGGMGEVYRAHDSRLGRDVAIKVLPAHLAATPEVRARFEREARTVSQLNHPHICTLFDVGHQDGVDYLVMELLEGETLAHRLEKGPLPVAEVLSLGQQIAGALDRAHRAGVVHRDLKPGNVMLTKGVAKLMDFGLARTHGLAPVAGALTQSPTVAQPLTAEGTIVGTFQYMAPEQLEGKEADARSDLWGLGCVLYEMATGARAFAGGTQASLIAAIMAGAPRAMTELQPVTPPALERIVRRCLAKDRDERFANAGDLGFALETVDESPVGTGLLAPRAVRRSRLRLAWIVGVSALVAGSLLGVIAEQRIVGTGGVEGNGAGIVRRFDLVLPDSLPMAYVGSAVLAVEQRSLALSPRGDALVYVAADRGSTRLVTLDLTLGTVDSLPGTRGAFGPFFSPDGNWVGFLTATELKKVALHGATPVVLTDVDEPYGAQWLDKERIIVAERQGRVLTFVRVGGGRYDSLFVTATGAYSPLLTPDRSALLWSWSRQMAYLDIKSGKSSRLTVRGRVPENSATSTDLLYGPSPVLLPSNHLLYVPSGGGGTLIGLPVAPGTLRPLANPVQIATDVRVSDNGQMSQSCVSSGVLVYASDPGSGVTHFVRRWANGRVDSLAFPSAEYGSFELSPDGSRIAVLQWPPSGQAELWIFDLARGTRERVCEAIYTGTWSADGKAVLYMTPPSPSEPPMTLRRHLDGSGRVDTLARGGSLVRAVSPDGRWALRTTLTSYGGVVARGERFQHESGFSPNISTLGRFSPDSRWLAATYMEAGRSEVYIAPVDQPARRVRVSTAGGEEPRWSADGRQVVYRYGKDWYKASFQPGLAAPVGSPMKLFTGPYANVPGYEHDLFPDGSNLLLLGSGKDVAHRLHVVTNLEALFATGARLAP